MEDFETALKIMQPSTKLKGFLTVPDVSWEDVGGLENIRQELKITMLGPLKYSHLFVKMGLSIPTGVLLCGPPGCGKTLLAKAVIQNTKMNFVSVKGQDYVKSNFREKERVVRQCFDWARYHQPSVIFFDDIDVLFAKCSNMDVGASQFLNQLLNEMDDIKLEPKIFLLAATNKPEIVDSAVLQPGRLEKVLYVDFPTASERVDILRTITKGGTKPLLDDDVDLAKIGESAHCEGFSGANLEALVREASTQFLSETFFMVIDQFEPQQLRVSSRHFTSALRKIRPSLSQQDKEKYEFLRSLYADLPTTD